ncbi:MULTISPECIES: methyltransferase domain-containing protein [Streptomyces]|uniref:Methyltransferase domain-containing protein n=1 Tax=Streptomyces chengmaiensis TaxID=3040919 RepID=A0ABT6HWE4_9ACTN|nr:MULTISPECIES: methyltransferase domain-containing protein [Streptomyces]MDH2393015.1 methyltransferase domain-containing protein [Streptomyces chengmaiensis]WRQ82835.1 methyltransferase domain-containing protein [Streptomyces sp. MUM 178J]
MSRIQSFERSIARSRASLTREDRPETFTLCGREWDLLDEVFAPVYSPSTGIALEFLGLNHEPPLPHSGSFLEVGCGTGVIAVMAALAGYERVVASDISPRAVENAAVNAERHGVTGRFRAVHSDLFSGLDDGQRFDTVFWSSNYVLGPEQYEYKSVHEQAYVDAGYRTHRRYLEQVLNRLAPGGSALLHFSNRGDEATLHRIAEECGRELRTVRADTVREGEYGDDSVTHMLLQIVPAATV